MSIDAHRTDAPAPPGHPVVLVIAIVALVLAVWALVWIPLGP